MESITNSQKNSVFHEGFDSIIRFLNASTFYDLLTPCRNFGVWLYNHDRPHMSLDLDRLETPARTFDRKMLHRDRRSSTNRRERNTMSCRGHTTFWISQTPP